MEAEVARAAAAKAAGGRISEECFVRIMLASPVATGRALADAFRHVLGDETPVVSRPSIEGTRDAWVGFYKAMAEAAVARMVADGAQQAQQLGREFAVAFVLHCQDECDARMRSGERRDTPSIPRRGRSSKVEQHVVRVAVGGASREWPCELEALGDKTGATLATSFEALLRRIAAGGVARRSASGERGGDQPRVSGERGGKRQRASRECGDGDEASGERGGDQQRANSEAAQGCLILRLLPRSSAHFSAAHYYRRRDQLQRRRGETTVCVHCC